MRAYVIEDSFGMDNLVVVERPSPQPGPGQIKLKMRSVSLNFRDLLMIQGMYNPRQKLPVIPCSDGVGEVIGLGEGVDREWMGKRVMPIFAQDWYSGEPTRKKLSSTLGGPRDGTLAEEMVVPAESVVEVPSNLSDEQGAALPCAAVTAWNAVVEQGGLKAGETLLTLGTGGVSLFAAQFGQMIGARVIVTSSSDEKLERVLSLFADEGINYRSEKEWGKAARKLTDDRGVDQVIEVGGAGTLKQSIRAVRIGGQISLIGVLSGGIQELNVIPILMQNIRIQGVIVGHREMFERMCRAIEVNDIKPVIDRVVEFDEVKEAFDHMAEGAHFGKICVKVGS